MGSKGIEGLIVETHNWGKSVAFWRDLGYDLEQSPQNDITTQNDITFSNSGSIYGKSFFLEGPSEIVLDKSRTRLSRLTRIGSIASINAPIELCRSCADQSTILVDMSRVNPSDWEACSCF